MSQSDFGKLIGISQNSISQIETGIKNPSYNTIASICSVFEIPISFIYLLAIETNDVAEEKKQVFEVLFKPAIKELIGRFLVTSDRSSLYLTDFYGSFL